MIEIAVPVVDLVRFCYRSGDIDHRFSPSPSASQGIDGHQRVYRRRPQRYQREVSLSARLQREGMLLLLRGRADGYDPDGPVLEEIKTCRVPFERIPPAVSRMHLAQARLYAAMLAGQENLAEVTVRLTWFNIDSGEEQSLDQRYQRAELEAFLDESLERFSSWLLRLGELRRERDRSLVQLDFPHGEFRAGQREVAELVYKCADQGGQLMVEAPTGIGKTAAVLYPALKAIAAGKHDALIYATARVVGRRAAEDTLTLFREAGMRGTALSLTAREGVCLSPGKACHGDDCPFARGYYDRLEGALEDAMAAPALRREELLELAERHRVCPYELALDLLPWVDLVIADLHHLYSLGALLGPQRERDGRRWSALLDEAHNLPGRARKLYRGELAKAELMAARKQAPRPLARVLERLNRRLLALQKSDWEEPEFDCREALPVGLEDDLQAVTTAVAGQLATDPLVLRRNVALADFYHTVLQFQRVSEQWGEDFRFEMSRGRGSQSLRLVLNCLDPSRLLAERQRSLHSITAFSATLSPAHWCRPALGLAEAAVCTRQASPFGQDQLQVQLATWVDTRYSQRAASMPALAAVLRDWLRDAPGNCIVYFPSYRYLQDALQALGYGASRESAAAASALPEQAPSGPDGRCWWVQERDAGREAQYRLLELLRERRDVAAFCILGGVFGEGVDLPGEQLASVVVVGVGLPQVSRDTERLRAWHQSRGGDGFEKAYLYPGMQKVDQALGRVVRRMQDRGRALLVDSRYREGAYRDLLPPWWSYRERDPGPAPGSGTPPE